MFIVFHCLAQKGSNTPGNRGKEPRPANRRGTLCPGASGPTAPRRIAGPRSTPIKITLPQKGSNTPGNRGKEPRPANRRGTLCPGASGPTAPRRIAGPRSTPIKITLPVPLWGPIEWCPEGSQRSTARETRLGLVTDNLAEANMDEETVAGWPVPASDKNLNRFYEASQKTKGDYPGMLQYREYGWNNVSNSIRVKLSPGYTIETRSRLVGREMSAQMWKKSSGESTDAVTEDIFNTVNCKPGDWCWHLAWHLAWLLDLVGWPPMLWGAWMTVVTTTYSCCWLKYVVCWVACRDGWEGWRSAVRKTAGQRLGGRIKRVISKHSLACRSRSPEGMLLVHEVVWPGSTESGLVACRLGDHAKRRQRSP